MTQVQFIADGDGLRATQAEVNRETRQCQNTDDDQARAKIERRIRRLAHMVPDGRPGEDPFAADPKATTEPTCTAPRWARDPWRHISGRF